MFIQYPTRKREVPARHIIPNLITTISLCCGLASIHLSLKADWDRAMLAILLAAVFDALDGRAARLLKATSSFGAVLDSLADFLSFGVAPAMFLHQWAMKDTDVWGLAAVMTFVLCSALRLARFTANVKPAKVAPLADESSPEARAEAQQQHVQNLLAAKFFTGMPTPAAAAAAIVPAMLSNSKLIARLTAGSLTANPPPAGGIALPFAGFIVVWTFLIAWLMVSRQPMFSFKKVRVSRHMVVPMLLVVGLVAVLAVKDIWLMVSLLVLSYMAMLPLSIRQHAKLSRGVAEPAQAGDSGEQPRLRIRTGR